MNGRLLRFVENADERLEDPGECPDEPGEQGVGGKFRITACADFD